ncbi:MAG: hypothetical protein H6713_30755 [Myxococcales bacterium]|nr:hypothetical protein [Myxococcales bacterium]MCB9754345.1 hypothetical protein [Myxococcales bacterium]
MVLSRRAHARIFAVACVLLTLLHFDVWNNHRALPLTFGWMPVDLAYHVGWIVVATALVFYMTARVWPTPPAPEPSAETSTRANGE